MIVDWVMNQKKMPANTSADSSPNDCSFHSPASPLQAINPPPVNSILAPAAVAAADPMNAPPAGHFPTGHSEAQSNSDCNYSIIGHWSEFGVPNSTNY